MNQEALKFMNAAWVESQDHLRQAHFDIAKLKTRIAKLREALEAIEANKRPGGLRKIARAALKEGGE